MTVTSLPIPSHCVRPTAWKAIGTTVSVLTTGTVAQHHQAEALMRAELTAADRAASRFRPDSELAVLNRRQGRLNRRHGRWTTVSPLLYAMLDRSLEVARLTDGLVVPVLGRELAALGYDRDFALLSQRLTFDVVESDDRVNPPVIRPRWTSTTPTWRDVELDPDNRRVRLPSGMALDPGAVGKAFLADRLATRIGTTIESECLVNLGGDIAIGASGRQWTVDIDESTPGRTAAVRSRVGLTDGGLATSSTAVRTWAAHGVRCHHIIDPRTGSPAPVVWSFASVWAGDCVLANAASTAALVLGRRAPEWLSARGFDARLVGVAGEVVRTGRWPKDRSAELTAS